MYSPVQRDSTYSNSSISKTQLDRSSAHVSQRRWYGKCPHLTDGRVHEVKTRTDGGPSRDDEGDEDDIVEAMVERRMRKMEKKEKNRGVLEMRGRKWA